MKNILTDQSFFAAIFDFFSKTQKLVSILRVSSKLLKKIQRVSTTQKVNHRRGEGGENNFSKTNYFTFNDSLEIRKTIVVLRRSSCLPTVL